jgi:hypothetical protein
VRDDVGGSDGEIAATIRRFLTARREWELQTMERVTGWRRGDEVDPDKSPEMDFEELDRAWADLAALRATWCTEAAVSRLDPKASFGTSPEFNPDGLSILELSIITDASAMVRTREFAYQEHGSEPTQYEYRLRRVGPGWRIDSRASVEPGWDRIEDLL